MHVAIAWDNKPLLLLTTALLPNRTTESSQMEAGPSYDKQRIQIGLRNGNTVLIYFRSGVDHYQSVLIALASDLSTQKPWQGQDKFWKYVSPIRTYFAWLPEQLALTYCRAALEMRPRLPYRRAPLAGTRVRLPAFHGVPKHLSYWGYQKCPRTGGLSTHAP